VSDGVLAVGDRVGAYRVTGHLIGNTYEGVHASTARPVLIEVAAIEDWRDAMLQMMRAQRLEKLHHPGVAPIIAHGVLPDHRPWLATEVPNGIHRHELIADRAMTPMEVAALMRDAADVLAHAHARGIVHRALTLRSLIRTPGEFPLCIVHWGLRLGELGVFGAPELSMGGSFDGRADVYALGVIAFRAATQHFPGEGGVYDMADVPAGLATLIGRTLSIAPEERPIAAEVRALANELVVCGLELVRGRARFTRARWTPPPPDLPDLGEDSTTLVDELDETIEP